MSSSLEELKTITHHKFNIEELEKQKVNFIGQIQNGNGSVFDDVNIDRDSFSVSLYGKTAAATPRLIMFDGQFRFFEYKFVYSDEVELFTFYLSWIGKVTLDKTERQEFHGASNPNFLKFLALEISSSMIEKGLFD